MMFPGGPEQEGVFQLLRLGQGIPAPAGDDVGDTVLVEPLVVMDVPGEDEIGPALLQDRKEEFSGLERPPGQGQEEE